jgi:hypothetical protein
MQQKPRKHYLEESHLEVFSTLFPTPSGKYHPKNQQIQSNFNGSSQPWPTKIGSRAEFLKNRHVESQNMDFS